MEYALVATMVLALAACTPATVRETVSDNGVVVIEPTAAGCSFAAAVLP